MDCPWNDQLMQTMLPILIPYLSILLLFIAGVLVFMIKQEVSNARSLRASGDIFNIADEAEHIATHAWINTIDQKAGAVTMQKESCQV